MTRMPTVFIAHGAPTLVLEQHPYAQFLREEAAGILPRPKAIVLFTAHWESRLQKINASEQPPLVYDFSGFSAELYRMTYTAPGSPELAATVQQLLAASGVEAALSVDRGWDHGVWTVLKMVYPDAQIPVVALSVNPQRSTAEQYAIGKALAPLRDQGVLIAGSGGTSHNLSRLQWGSDAAEPWTVEYEEWLEKTLVEWNVPQLLDYESQAPHAKLAVPRNEHFVPLLLAMGACDETKKAELLHRSYQMGTLSLDFWRFS